MALAVPNPPTTPRRVKVYELRNSDWFDRGTGYCTGQILNVGAYIVCNQKHLCHKLTEIQDEPHIQVKSEEEADKLLLDTKIVKDDGYQKQQGTFDVCVRGDWTFWLIERCRDSHCMD